MPHTPAVIATIAAVLVAGCAQDTPNATASAASASSRPFEQRVVTTINQPWAAAFLPGTPYLAITTKPGKLLLRHRTTGKVLTVSGTPTVLAQGQGGLGDIRPAPGYNGRNNRTIYLTWVQAGRNGTAGAAMGRGQLTITPGGAKLENFRQIWSQSPKVAGRGHYSHRIAFSPDGRYLFLTSGERQRMTPAQDLTNTLGKVLRLNLDGTPARGNPYAARGGVAREIWSYGHRNLLGIAFAPDGRLWESEMGPKGGDELNLIRAKANYGWPKASNGSHYDGRDIPDHRPGDGFEAPKVWWNPSISPANLMIYTGTAFPGWKGDAFVGGLSGQCLIRLDLNGSSARRAEQWNLGMRIREVEQDPDGSIWLLTDGTGGKLIHLTPKR